MMKPEPSEVTWRGRLGPAPRKSLNRSASGEPGGMLGRPGAPGAGFKVWVVAMLTTVGSSRAAISAKDAGAPRTGTIGAGAAGAGRAGGLAGGAADELESMTATAAAVSQ